MKTEESGLFEAWGEFEAFGTLLLLFWEVFAEDDFWGWLCDDDFLADEEPAGIFLLPEVVGNGGTFFDEDAAGLLDEALGFWEEVEGFGAEGEGFGAEPEGFGAEAEGFGVETEGLFWEPEGLSGNYKKRWWFHRLHRW